MAEQTKTSPRVHKITPVSLRELIHGHVRHAIEAVVHEEVTTVPGAAPSEPRGPRGGYHNGHTARTLTPRPPLPRRPRPSPYRCAARAVGRSPLDPVGAVAQTLR